MRANECNECRMTASLSCVFHWGVGFGAGSALPGLGKSDASLLYATLERKWWDLSQQVRWNRWGWVASRTEHPVLWHRPRHFGAQHARGHGHGEVQARRSLSSPQLYQWAETLEHRHTVLAQTLEYKLGNQDPSGVKKGKEAVDSINFWASRRRAISPSSHWAAKCNSSCPHTRKVAAPRPSVNMSTDSGHASQKPLASKRRFGSTQVSSSHHFLQRPCLHCGRPQPQNLEGEAWWGEGRDLFGGKGFGIGLDKLHSPEAIEFHEDHANIVDSSNSRILVVDMPQNQLRQFHQALRVSSILSSCRSVREASHQESRIFLADCKGLALLQSAWDTNSPPNVTFFVQLTHQVF